MPLEIFGQESKFDTKVQSDRKKTRFVDLSSTATIRILSDARYVTYTHYLNRANVECLGDDCPICNNNRNLIMQFPDNFRDEPHYSPKRLIKMVNVLDKTPVRKCAQCDIEVKSGMNCPSCNGILAGEPKPSNTVKVLSRGITLFDNLDAINNAILDDSGEVVGITKYDVTLVVAGTGKNKTITPIAGRVGEPDVVNPEDLFDLETVTIKLNPSEMLDLQRGVSLRDIFAARRAEAQKSANETPAFIDPKVEGDVRSAVDDLFKV